MSWQGFFYSNVNISPTSPFHFRLEMAMDALRCPPGETPVKILSGGIRVANLL
jgi:hypothetical protein